MPARFVECSDQRTITNIITFNNSQNRLEAADFRSNDPVQRRLRDEFQNIPDAEYQGGRRGGYEDVIKRVPNLLPADTCAQGPFAVDENGRDFRTLTERRNLKLESFRPSSHSLVSNA